MSKESSVSNSKKIYSKGGDYSSEIISIGKEIVESKNLEENIERLNLFLDEENFDKKLQPVCYDLIIQAHHFSKNYEDSIESINELFNLFRSSEFQDSDIREKFEPNTTVFLGLNYFKLGKYREANEKFRWKKIDFNNWNKNEIIYLKSIQPKE